MFGDDRRIFLGLKFSVPEFFWIGKYGKYFFGCLDLGRNFFGIKTNLKLVVLRINYVKICYSFSDQIKIKTLWGRNPFIAYVSRLTHTNFNIGYTTPGMKEIFCCSLTLCRIFLISATLLSAPILRFRPVHNIYHTLSFI